MTATLDLTTCLPVLKQLVAEAVGATGPAAPHWPARLWEVHRDTRLTVAEAAAALDRSPSWVHAKIRAGELPAVTFDGERRVIAGQLRDWLHQREAITVPPRLG